MQSMKTQNKTYARNYEGNRPLWTPEVYFRLATSKKHTTLLNKIISFFYENVSIK